MRIAVYISGHGFGHLAQMAPVLNRIYALNPESRFLIRCPLPEAEIRARLNFDFEHDPVQVDVGVVQKSAVEEDREASLKQMEQWAGSLDSLISCELQQMRAFRPALILSNISPLAFPVASILGVPGIGLASLDWHTIYSHWLPAQHPAITSLADAYGVCDLLLTPPMSMEMRVFPRQKSIPLLAGYPTTMAAPQTGIGKCALVLFGGSARPPFDLAALAAMPGWQFLLPDAPADLPANVTPVRFAAAMRPIDLMPHVDVVLCKPGYGVLSECWRTGRPIAWVERPDFPEFPMLRGWLEERFPAAGMSRDDFRRGRWLPALEAAIGSERCFPPLAEDGARVAAELILSRRC